MIKSTSLKAVLTHNNLNFINFVRNENKIKLYIDGCISIKKNNKTRKRNLVF